MTPIDPDAFDRALSRRLAQLGEMPVDTSSLDRSLRAEIPPAAPAAPRWRTLLKPISAIAASLAFQGQNAQASTAAMVQMHRDIVDGKIKTMQVDSIDAANQAIAAFAGDFPALSAPPQAHTMACCMRNVGNKKVACVLLQAQGVPVTLSIADADAVETAGTSTFTRNGQTYHVQTMGDLSMVMTDRGTHHVCVIGALPVEKLVTLVENVKL